MMSREHVRQYAALLRIRQAAAKRNVVITGVIFVASTFGALISNLYVEPNNRSLFLMTILIVGFGLGFLFAWVRFDAIRDTLELTDVLDQTDG